MSDLLQLNRLELDALRETANIGAGHAATALSHMTNNTIMITVPTITIAALEDVPSQIEDGEEPIAAVL
ncbi:MAG TPA: chemotaxis protein CheC, partial [Gemmatimonadaceae bacterium]|nr:chemotaxis protein CheC [Gemmatimonadaceae bacterium]